MPLPQPLAQGAKQLVARRIKLVAQRLGCGIERREVIAIGLELAASSRPARRAAAMLSPRRAST
jgi:hypothetical protein